MPSASALSSCSELQRLVFEIPLSSINPQVLVYILTITLCDMGLSGRYSPVLGFNNALPANENFHVLQLASHRITVGSARQALLQQELVAAQYMQQKFINTKSVDAGYLGSAVCDADRCTVPVQVKKFSGDVTPVAKNAAAHLVGATSAVGANFSPVAAGTSFLPRRANQSSSNFMPAYAGKSNLGRSAASAKPVRALPSLCVPMQNFKRKDNVLANKNHTKRVDAATTHKIPKLRNRA